jgi:DNA gyrase subunit A
MAIRFDEDEARQMGRNARGVRGVELEGDDEVAGMVTASDADDHDLLTVTKHGYGKRTPLAEYRKQSRNGKGLVDIKTGDRNGPVTSVKAVGSDDELVIMSEGGQIMRIRAADISEVGRNTMGVKVMELEGDDTVASVDVLPAATGTSDEPSETVEREE